MSQSESHTLIEKPSPSLAGRSFEPVARPDRPLQIPNTPWRLSWAMWWIFASAGALAPLQPLYFEEMGMTRSETALLLAVPAVASTVTSQVCGYLADTRFTRPALISAMCALAAVMGALFTWLPNDFGWLAMGVLLFSTFASNRVSMLNAVTLGSRGGERIYARVRLMGSLSFTVVALLAGWLADIPWLGVAIIWPLAMAGEIAALFATRRVHDLSPEARLRAGNSGSRLSFVQAQRQILADPLIRIFLVFTLLTQLSLPTGTYLQANFLRELGTSTLFAMMAVAAGVLSEMVVFWHARGIMKRVPILPLMFIGAAALAVRWGLIYFFPDPLVLFATNMLHALTFGVAFLVGVHFMNREAPAHLRSSAQTIFGTIYFSVPMLLGSLLASVALKFTDLHGFYGLCALQALTALVLFIPLRRGYLARHGEGSRHFEH